MYKQGKTLDPLKDGLSSVQLIDFMGEDLSVVNDARASFKRVSEEMSDRDIKLLNYLIKHDHNSPLRGTVFKFRVKAPLYIARQWWKHVVGSSHVSDQVGWNEQSLRYTKVVSTEFYMPKVFRGQSKDNRQASGDALTPEVQDEVKKQYFQVCSLACETYDKLIEQGVARESARGVLPAAMYTTWVWTASLQALLHFIDLRADKASQTEMTQYARAIKELLTEFVPYSMKAWNEKTMQKSG